MDPRVGVAIVNIQAPTSIHYNDTRVQIYCSLKLQEEMD